MTSETIYNQWTFRKFSWRRLYAAAPVFAVVDMARASQNYLSKILDEFQGFMSGKIPKTIFL
jgi:hypothetical protein